MSAVEPFRIAIPEKQIFRLKQKLELTELPDEVESSTPSSRGSPLEDIQRLLKTWQTGYSWRKAEEKLNTFPQQIIKVDVEGFGALSVHAIHIKSALEGAIPLLFLHGWPGSFIEATKIAPKLVEISPHAPTFHVVAVSLIDYGFSSASKKEGFTVEKHAEAYHKVMLALGYPEYVVQGGDVGYLVARSIADLYPQACRAYHVNMTAPKEPTREEFPEIFEKLKDYKPDEKTIERLERTRNYHVEGSGYMIQQSTKPQSIAYSMRDSPVGLLGWIYEKLRDWSDSYPWTDEEVLTWVSIYWFSVAGPHASQRIYYEMYHSKPPGFEKQAKYIDVKLGISRFPKDIAQFPNLWDRTLGPIVFERDHDFGGHFAAWECPELIVQDLRDMFGRDGGAYCCVKGHSGFEC